jgi:hypothetical protein
MVEFVQLTDKGKSELIKHMSVRSDVDNEGAV